MSRPPPSLFEQMPDLLYGVEVAGVGGQELGDKFILVEQFNNVVGVMDAEVVHHNDCFSSCTNCFKLHDKLHECPGVVGASEDVREDEAFLKAQRTNNTYRMSSALGQLNLHSIS